MKRVFMKYLFILISLITPVYLLSETPSSLQEGCIFCSIIHNPSKARVVYETEKVIVIEDINPRAPIHLLIIPKKHIVNMKELLDEDAPYIAEMGIVSREISHSLLCDVKDFNLVSNNGKMAGQTVFHMHWHFLCGKQDSFARFPSKN